MCKITLINELVLMLFRLDIIDTPKLPLTTVIIIIVIIVSKMIK